VDQILEFPFPYTGEILQVAITGETAKLEPEKGTGNLLKRGRDTLKVSSRFVKDGAVV